MSKIYLSIALPKITCHAPLELTRAEFDFLLEQNLSQLEFTYIRDLRAIRDIENALLWFQGKEMYSIGNYSQSEYTIALLEENRHKLPKSLFEFMYQYPNPSERKKRAYSLLFSHLKNKRFFQNSQSHPIVEKIYTIEHLFRLFSAYLQSKEKNRYDDATYYQNEIITTVGSSNNIGKEWYSEECYELDTLWSEYQHSPAELEKSFFEWKFTAFEKLAEDHQKYINSPFTIDDILIYCAQYDLVELQNRQQQIDCQSLIERISQKGQHTT